MRYLSSTALFTLFTLIAPMASSREADAGTDLEARLSSAMVRIHTAWLVGVGYLVNDNKTVIAPGVILDTGREYHVRPFDQDGPEATSVRVEHFDNPHGPAIQVLHLDRELPGVPLAVSQAEVALGDEVITLRPTGDEERPFELVRTTVTATSRSALDVAAGSSGGMPLVDQAGDLLGVSTTAGTAVRSGEVFGHLEERPFAITPLVGVRMGLISGGGMDQAFAVNFDFGLSLWDRLSLVGVVGFGLDEQETLSQDGGADLGIGSVQGSEVAVNLGLEVRYRWLLGSWETGDLYLDLAAGGVAGYHTFSASGQAFFGGPGCDPGFEVCPLAMRDADDFLGGTKGWDFGLSVGADLRFNGMSLGYRYQPGAVSTLGVDTHTFLFGMSIF